MIHWGLPAYVGPGAGFAFLGSFLSLVSAVLAGLLSVLLWPFRRAWLWLAGPRNAQVKKAIFLGFEGLDRAAIEKLMARFRDHGSCTRLAATIPPLPDVAWATFATGVNPGKHNVFNQAVQRKGETFWKVLGKQGVKSTVLWVSGKLAPERFNGREVAGSLSYPRYYNGYLTRLLGAESTQEEIYLSVLANTRRGLIACVFDAGCDVDRIVGETLARIDAETALFVLSVHASQNSVKLREWLEREGYAGRANAFGRSGITVSRDLKKELTAKLRELPGVGHVYDASEIYRGPYANAGPDLVIGDEGCAGVLFSNRRITMDNPRMEDMAATALDLFGVAAPEFLEGRSVIAPA